MHFLKSLKGEIKLSGDFNLNTLKKEKDKYTNLLVAYDFEVLKFSPTTVMPISKTCRG